MMRGVGLTLVQEELSAHIGGEVTAVVAAEGHHQAAQPGQSEVVIWSRDLGWTNHSSPPAAAHHRQLRLVKGRLGQARRASRGQGPAALQPALLQ